MTTSTWATLACVLVACAAPNDRSAPPRDTARAPTTNVSPSLAAPGLRLPGDVEPLAYRLRLNIDPDRTTFSGQVEIDVRFARPAHAFWLHAKDLEITKARARTSGSEVELRVRPEVGDEMLALGADRELAGAVTLELDYRGAIREDQIGLFRQRAGGKWFAFTQGQSVFTRMFVPSFDEPRFKTPWKVTLRVPAGDVALTNAPQVAETRLADGSREVEFAVTDPMASYLLAVAVGPFALVDGGVLGRSQVPFRVAVMPDQMSEVAHVAKRTDGLLRYLETYFGSNLPWPKVDFVAVPEFFGAMENPGLITFRANTLFDADRGEDSFAAVTAHELAHQWIGNWVTPAWWDDLWFSEGFAQHLGNAAAAEVGETSRRPWVQATTRATALMGDASSPSQLRHPRLVNEAIDDAFDSTSYTKGATLVVTLERALGHDTLRDVVRAALAQHARGSITTDSFIERVASVDRAVAESLAWMLSYRGVPTVDVELSCAPAVVRVTARDQGRVPVCVRVEGQRTPAPVCAVTSGDGPTELRFALAKGTSCPTWVVGNAGGVGYYLVDKARTDATQNKASLDAPLTALTGPERLARGADMAASFLRGDRSAKQALATARALLARTDSEARYGGVQIIRAVDTIVDAETRPAWEKWRARQLAPIIKLAAPRPTNPAPITTMGREAQDLVEDASELVSPPLDRRTLEAMIAKARMTTGVAQADLLGNLGSVDATLASDVVALLVDRVFSATLVSPAVVSLVSRADARDAAWAAIQPRADRIVAALSPADARAFVLALGGLCTPEAPHEIQLTFGRYLASLPDGAALLGTVRDSIERCVRVRVAAGDVAAALGP